MILGILTGLHNQIHDLGFWNLGQNGYGTSQNNFSSGQNCYGFGQNNFALGQNCYADGYNGFREQHGGPNVGWPRPNVECHVSRPQTLGPYDSGPNGGEDGGFRPMSGVGPNAPLMPTNPILNNVQIDPSIPTGNIVGPWRTKPRARVVFASNPCFGLPRVGDLHASDYFDPSVFGSHINSTQHGVSGDGFDSPVSGPVGTSSW